MIKYFFIFLFLMFFSLNCSVQPTSDETIPSEKSIKKKKKRIPEKSRYSEEEETSAGIKS